MTARFQKTLILLSAMLVVAVCPSFAEESTTALIIHPVINTPACISSSALSGADSISSELCITQGGLAYDRYVLKLDGEVALRGIDAETMSGIAATHKGKAVTLKCSSQSIMPKATAEDIRKVVPSYPNDKVNEIAELMAASRMPIEIARLCLITVADVETMKVQVFFD